MTSESEIKLRNRTNNEYSDVFRYSKIGEQQENGVTSGDQLGLYMRGVSSHSMALSVEQMLS